MINIVPDHGSTLYIYNLETDKNSRVLSVGHQWIQCLSEEFQHVYVFSTHVGTTELPENVIVKELGGGSAKSRVVHVLRLYKSLFYLFKNRRHAFVFYHMSTRSMFFLGFFIKLMGVPQGLWYAHSVGDIFLRLSSKVPEVVFTPIKGAFPLPSSNIKAIGHGIQSLNFLNLNPANERRDILALGRVSKIKNIEPLIDALAREKIKLSIHLTGPTDGDKSYLFDLKLRSEIAGVNLEHVGALPYSKIPELMAEYKYIYSGTPKSLDKVAVEGAMAGCFVISENMEVLAQVGMEEIWNLLGLHPGEIGHQLMRLEELDAKRQANLRQILILSAVRKNDIKVTCNKIAQSLIQLKGVVK